MHYDTGAFEQIMIIFSVSSLTMLFWKGVFGLIVFAFTGDFR